MIEIGSTIIYGTNICKVLEVKPMTMGKTTRDYYVLAPVWDSKNLIYVPVDNEALAAKIKKILSAEEINSIIKAIPESDALLIADDRERIAEFKSIIDSGEREKIINVIRTLFLRKKELESKHRKLHSADEAILNRAEKLICEEFALVLGINKDEVVPYIAARLDE